MENDLRIVSNYNRTETINRIESYLNDSFFSDFSLTTSSDTFFIQRTKINWFKNKNYLDFLLLQFTLAERQGKVVIELTSQTKLVSLLIKIMFIPLIWIFILVFCITDDVDLMSIIFVLLAGFLGTCLLFYVQTRSTKLETNLIIGIRNKLK